MKQHAVCMQVGQLLSNTKACDHTVWKFLIGSYLDHSGGGVQINRAWKNSNIHSSNQYILIYIEHSVLQFCSPPSAYMLTIHIYIYAASLNLR